jgi:hypothetical protein
MLEYLTKLVKGSSVKTGVPDVKRYPKIVEQIHNEFYSASEILLQQAKDILNSVVLPDEEKLTMLKTLGFNSTKEVVELEDKNYKINRANSMHKRIMDYSIKYPNNKFITEDMVRSICKKYSLVFGGVHLYKGFVPQKNLMEIDAFVKQNTHKDALLCVHADRSNTGGTFYLKDAEVRMSMHGPFYHIFKKGTRDKYTINGDHDEYRRSYAFQSDNGVDFYSSDDNNLFGMEDKGSIRFTIKSKLPLSICAPIKDMNTEGMRLNDYKLEKHVPDPVVLFGVEGGYLIVTAWGDEASDEMVVNHKHN